MSASHLFLLLFLTFCIFWLNIALGGSIATPAKLAAEFKAPPDSPQEWTLKRSAPTKYRVLFRWLVTGTWRLMSSNEGAEGFHGTYVSWSIICFCATVVCLYSLLKLLGFAPRHSFAGCLLFLASPPVALAYIYPNHTREDPLAYFLVIAGIIAALRSRRWLLSTLAVLGALTRETALIVLVPYLLAPNDPPRKKLLVCVPPVASVVGIRFLLGCETYNPFLASVRNIQVLPESLFFLFLVFGALWAPGVMQLRWLRRRNPTLSSTWGVLGSSGPLALILILGTHLLLARAREIRVSFLLFPWMIPLALEWLRTNLYRLRPLLRRPAYWGFSLAGVATAVISLLYVKANTPSYVAYAWAFPWLVIGSMHLLATLAIILPASLRSGDT